MSDQWIKANLALDQVVAIELNPNVAQTKLIEAIKGGTMPAKALADGEERFLSADLFRGRHGWLKVDWATGAGRYLEMHFVQGQPPLADWSFTDLQVGRRHINELWPQSSTDEGHTGRPKGTGFSGADASIIEEMYGLIKTHSASSPTAAAWKVIGRDGARASGSGTPESKVRRIVSAYKAKYENGV
jgi:hypothetical protein